MPCAKFQELERLRAEKRVMAKDMKMTMVMVMIMEMMMMMIIHMTSRGKPFMHTSCTRNFRRWRGCEGRGAKWPRT